MIQPETWLLVEAVYLLLSPPLQGKLDKDCACIRCVLQLATVQNQVSFVRKSRPLMRKGPFCRLVRLIDSRGSESCF